MELLSQKTIAELQTSLAAREPVVYGRNGNRATDGRALLRRLEALMPVLGVTRVADISRLVPNRFPVFQSTRPRLHLHHSLGQNTGAQGKGADRRQAKLSCLMESVESYCAEPRNPRLVRGSYETLRRQHAVMPPQSFSRCQKARAPADTEPLMWTPSLHVRSGTEVLVPAETVYFPFLAASFGTRAVFPCSTNGLASGATYLEATLHALYEIIERMYIALSERRALAVEALFETGYRAFDFQAFKEQEPDIEAQLYAFEIPGLRNLPMISCVLVGDDLTAYGWGCCAEVDTAISRALSEALQSYTLAVSGSREDLDDRGRATSRRSVRAFVQPSRRTLTLDELRRRTVNRTFADLQDEYRFVLRWLAALGLDDVCVTNLARHGIDIPVVKVVVAGVPLKRQLLGASSRSATLESSLAREYST